MTALYNDTGSAREATIQDLYNQLVYIIDRLEYGNLTDTAKRLKVNIEAGTTVRTLGVGAVTVTADTTRAVS